jgi:hypothetical protein
MRAKVPLRSVSPLAANVHTHDGSATSKSDCSAIGVV